jgi:hypothetical protein
MKVLSFDGLSLPFAAAMESDVTYEIPITVDHEYSEEEKHQLRLAIDERYSGNSKFDEFIGYKD